MKRSSIIAVLVVLLAVLSIAIFFDTNNKTNSKKSVDSAVSFLTSPIHSVSGVVEKVEGNTLTLAVSHPVSLPQGANPATVLGASSKIETMKFNVKVNSQTIYKGQNSSVPYLFGGDHQQPNESSINKVVVGQNVTVETNTDLRTLSNNMFTASAIITPVSANVLNGVVEKVVGNIITVNTVFGEKEAIITSSTEISSNFSDNQVVFTPKLYGVNDLKNNTRVTVYTDKDVTGGDVLTALRIDPIVLSHPRDVPPIKPTP